ncbi:recombinase family protein [Paenibacillus naphthalenovorans]|uniref:recombinase family protein n=1 Tax=Paenibacillus naphthalenovorans TaxID=162209 RepID=UPI003D2CA8D0
MNRTRVAAYCRVSTDKTDQLNSLRNQRDYFEKYCADRSLELVNVYADEGITGTSWRKRDDFVNMLKDAGLSVVQGKLETHLETSDKPPKFERILIKDVSRFARNAGNASEIIERLRHKGVHIDFITSGLSTDQMSADVLLKVMAVFAEAESRDRSAKVLFGQQRGAERGVVKMADIIYGYRYKKEENTLEIVPDEAESVRLMYELYVGGYGFRRLVNELEARGITTRRGKRFSPQSLRRILTNPVYKGDIVRNRFAKSVFDGRASAALRPESEWITHEGRVPAIVDAELWEKAQETRYSKVHSEQRRGVRISVSPYAGKIICGKCGSTYRKNREPRTGRDFFVCKMKKLNGVKACTSRNVGLDDIEALLDKVRGSDLPSIFAKHKQDVIHMIRTQVSLTLENRIDQQNEEAAKAKQAEIDELQEKRRKLMDLYLTGVFGNEEIQEKAAEIDGAIDFAKQQLRYLSKTNDEIKAEIADIERIIEEIQHLKFEDYDLLSVVKSITVNPLESRVPLLLEFTFSDVLGRIDTSSITGEIGEWLKIIHERAKGPVMLM